MHIRLVGIPILSTTPSQSGQLLTDFFFFNCSWASLCTVLMDPAQPATHPATAWGTTLWAVPRLVTGSRGITCEEMCFLKRLQMLTLGHARRRDTCYQALLLDQVM